MESKPRKSIRTWLRELEQRGDAWAAKRMTPEEFADAEALDRQIKRNFWTYVAYYLAAAGIGALLVVLVVPESSLGKAYFYSALALVYILATVASAWYGYRKWAQRPAWSVFVLFIDLMLMGFVAATFASLLKSGRPFTLAELRWEEMQQGLGFAILAGIAFSTVLVVISRLRSREVAQKSAALNAEAERERFARQSAQAELRALQAQIEPHFLFNTLANLRYLVQIGSPDALAMLDHLIHYLRTALPEIRAATSTLGREAELARAYLEIIRIRMGGALEIALDIPADLAAEPFPPLMLTTLAENAMKHGVTPVGRGRVAIRAARDNGCLRVEVEDDGRGLREPIGQGVGLANIRERLRALFGDEAGLELLGRESGGARAIIEVPA